MDKCVFCGWSRRAAYPAIRFFGIPKEPGMKRVQWLYAIGNREITNKDRVCSVHFRQGRPSSDPSHEDFVPHLFLNREPPPEVLQYLEEIAEMKPDPYAIGYEELMRSSRLQHGRTCKPLILKRKRKLTTTCAPATSAQLTAKHVSEEKPLGVATTSMRQEESSNTNATRNVLTVTLPETGQVKRVKLQMLQKPIVEAAGLKPGQTVIIKRRIPVIRTTLQSMQTATLEDRRVRQTQLNIPEENIIVAEEQTVQ
uniref:Ubiquitin-like domain-containing protein n=2 Tax=Parascaris univalens TaxID=6257 RepID=A0A914ZLX7_PARUN